MNTLQRVLSAISEADMRTAVGEMHTFGATGILSDGVVRRVAKELAAATGVNASNALPIVQTHVVRAAAFMWAGLPVFPEYPDSEAPELAITSSYRTPAENELAAAGKVKTPPTHLEPSLVGKNSPKFPGALCWEHTCFKSGEPVLLPFGMVCAQCKTADVATPRQRTAALMLGYRRAAVDGDKATERRAGEAVMALVETLATAAPDEDARRAATRTEVLSDVDPVVLECWKLQGRKVGAMLADAQAAVIELQEKLENATEEAQDADQPLNIQLSCGCKSAFHGFPAEWDTETRECTPAVAFGNICERHFHEWDARPQSVPVAAAPADGESPGPDYSQRATVYELRQLAKNAPHVTEEDVLEIALMPADELRRRAIRARDWHGHFAHSLDGIKEIRAMPGAAPDGCWSHKEVRAVVEQLVERGHLTWEDTCYGRPKTPASGSSESVAPAAQLNPPGIPRITEDGVVRLTPRQCASQFRMYADSPLQDASAKHQLNFCANFLDEYCSPDAPPDLLEALDCLMRVAHNLRREGKERALSAPECAVLGADERVRKHGWSWDPLAAPTVKHTPPAATPASEASPRRLREQEYLISGSVYRREDEWVLELKGLINDCSFVCRHTQPGTLSPQEVPGLPDHYSRLDKFEAQGAGKADGGS